MPLAPNLGLLRTPASVLSQPLLSCKCMRFWLISAATLRHSSRCNSESRRSSTTVHGQSAPPLGRVKIDSVRRSWCEFEKVLCVWELQLSRGELPPTERLQRTSFENWLKWPKNCFCCFFSILCSSRWSDLNCSVHLWWPPRCTTSPTTTRLSN